MTATKTAPATTTGTAGNAAATPGTPGTPAPSPSPTPGAPSGRISRPHAVSWLREAIRAAMDGTPGQLRAAMVAGVVAGLLFALLAGTALRDWRNALEEARAGAEQLVRMQTIQNDLVKADASATNDYLAGNARDPRSRTGYDAAIDQAARLLARSSASQQDTAELTTVAPALARYTELTEAARTNNRQRLQVGAAYQRQAGEVLRQEMVPALQRVSRADQQRVADAYDRANLATLGLVVASLIALGALGFIQYWLAHRTKRYINVPLAVGSAAVLFAILAGAITVGVAAAKARNVANGSYQTTVALAKARTAAFDAKAQESLGLINRGNASSTEQVAQAQTTAATEALTGSESWRPPDEVGNAFEQWVATHRQVRATDDGGDWLKAKTLALGASNTAFGQFDTLSADALAAEAARVDSGLSGPGTALLVVGVLASLVGVGAAAAAYAGVSQRLEEYR